MSIRPRVHTSVFYGFLFASLALLGACGGSYNGGNNGGGGPKYGAPIIATTAPPNGTANLAYSFTFMVSSGGQTPFTWSETGALPAGLGLASSGILSGTPTAAGSFTITIKVQDSASQSATKAVTIQIDPAAVSGSFSFTGSMATPRTFHTATLLSSGQVVVVGGKDNNGNAVATAETYEPGPGTFTPALTALNHARFSHTATLLDAFSILIAGGTGLAGTSLSSAEIYDSETGSFLNTAGPMTAARSQHTDSMLSDGTVLIAGGTDASGNALDTAEIYNPATKKFAATAGNMTTARFQHTATILDNGKVLLAGGVDATGVTTASTEIYDPATQTFTAAAPMADARAQHTAISIGLGSVLTNGGYSNGGQTVTALSSGQSYDSSFTPLLTDMVEPRAQHTITSLGTGIFILTGGANFVLANCGNNCVTYVPQSLSSAEGFSSFDLDFFPESAMNTPRRGHTATLLGDGGTILIVGGTNSALGARNELVETVLSSAELRK